MTDLLRAISHHGYLLLFLIVFAESCGLPAPAALALVAAGSAAATHALSPAFVFVIAISAMLVGDVFLFLLGRYTGWAFLGFICSISLNPETCILRSAESFYKHGRLTLLFIKFIPGVNTMAAPLAGSMKMKLPQFLQFDLAGAYLLHPGVRGCRLCLPRFRCSHHTRPRNRKSHRRHSGCFGGVGLHCLPRCAISSIAGLWRSPQSRRRRNRASSGIRGRKRRHPRRRAQPRILRCRLAAHCRIHSSRTESVGK